MSPQGIAGPVGPSAGGGLDPQEVLRLGDGVVVLLDQTRLPGEIVYRNCVRWEDVELAIRELAVRGAPAIGIAGAMGVALAAQLADHDDPAAYRAAVDAAAAALAAARPTAVNLSWAIDRQREILSGHPGPTEAMTASLRLFAKRLHSAEVARCRAIGVHGRSLIHRGARILTICNTGALATGGYGTALGVIRAAYARGSVGRRRRLRDAPTPPGGASDRLGARARRDPVRADHRLDGGGADGRRRGEPRDRRR